MGRLDRDQRNPYSALAASFEFLQLRHRKPVENETDFKKCKPKFEMVLTSSLSESAICSSISVARNFKYQFPVRSGSHFQNVFVLQIELSNRIESK